MTTCVCWQGMAHDERLKCAVGAELARDGISANLPDVPRGLHREQVHSYR